MRKINWKQLALAVCSGTILFQVPGCTETALYITSLASAVTAGTVVFLARKVID